MKTILQNTKSVDMDPPEVETLESLIYLGAMWGKIVPYLVDQCLYTPFDNGIAECQAQRSILKSDAYMISLLVMRSQLMNDRAMTLRQLSKALAPSDDVMQKSMARKIKRIVADANHFELMQAINDIHEITGQPVIRVKGLRNLNLFFNDVIYPSLPQGFSMEMNDA